MQWLTEMHKSHAPESPPCLPGVTAALRVRYHHLVSLGYNPSTIPSPPTVGLSQMRDKNSGECFWISKTDFICSVLIEHVAAEWWTVPKRHMPFLDTLSTERNIRLCRGPHISYVCLAVYQPLNLWEIPFILFPATVADSIPTAADSIPTAAPRGQGGERTRGWIWQQRSTNTLPRLALKQVCWVSTN